MAGQSSRAPLLGIAPDYALPALRRGRERSKFTMNVSRHPQGESKSFLLTAGNGNLGQLGLGVHYMETKHPMWVKMDHEIISAQAGGFHTICITDKGVVLTFGSNEEGSLGRNTTEQYSEFSPGPVHLPGKAKQVSAGEYHSVALLDTGCVYAWGSFKDSYGQMGLTLDGIQRYPVLVFANQPVLKIVSGANHFAVLTKDGEIHTMGCAEFGQLGRIPQRSANRYCRRGLEKQLNLSQIFLKPTKKVRFDNIWAGGDSTFAKVAGSNEIYVFGSNRYKQLSTTASDKIFSPIVSIDFSRYIWKEIVCDGEHTLALNTNKKVFVVGYQENGRLGLGPSISEVGALTQVVTISDPEICHIGIGPGTSFAAPEDGGLIVWGVGSSGQLGTGDDYDRHLPFLLNSRALDNKKVSKVSGGVRHSVFLAYHIVNPFDI